MLRTMEEILTSALALLATHGYIIIFLWMFADQAALPIPAIPLLVASGALAANGDLELAPVIAAAGIATIIADSLWFAIGRFGGGKAIAMVCRLSLEPDSCASSTRRAFSAFGPATLLIAKFLPGVQTLAPASMGFVRAPLWAFLLLDTIGTALFILPFILGGYFFQAQIVELLDSLRDISGGLTLGVLGILAIYGTVKITQWILFLREHKLSRVNPEDLLQRLESGQGTTIIDLRQQLDYELQPLGIPGALRIPMNEIHTRRDEIPTRHDVVLVCT